MILVIRIVVGVFGECSYGCAHHFDKYCVLSDFDYSVVGNKDTVRVCYAFENTFFTGYDKSRNASASIENQVAYVSEFFAVRHIYDCFFAQFLKRILSIIHTIFYSRARKI